MELNGEMFNIGLSSVTLQLQQKIAADVSDYAIDYPYSMSYNNSSTDFLEVNWTDCGRERLIEDINNNFNYRPLRYQTCSMKLMACHLGFFIDIRPQYQ